MRLPSPYASNRAAVLACGSLFLVGFSLAACQGSMKADAKAGADSSGKGEVDFDAAGSSDWENAEAGTDPSRHASTGKSGGAAPGTSPGSGAAALLGARHDLRLAPGSPARCECLALAVGGPDLPAFSWQAARPAINPGAQLVIGLSSAGVDCQVTGPAASYQGYVQRDEDIVVQVEPAVEGRPLTQGAVIPKPASGGRVLVEATGKVPYGKALGGQGPCVAYP